MRKIINKIAYIFIGISSCIFIFGQEQEKHEFSFYAASGLSTLHYSLEHGKRDNGIGGSVGLGYGFFFNENWGIISGTEVSCYNAKARLKPFGGSNYVAGKSLTYSYYVNDYYEKQSLVNISIPLMLQYQAPLLFEEHFCYAAIGGKISFPWQLKYKTSNAIISTTGIKDNIPELIESPESEGFGKFIEKPSKYSVGSNISYMASAEIGMKWYLTQLYYLYTGLYCEYGLTDIIKANPNQSFISYNEKSPSTIDHRSILESSHRLDNKPYNFTKEVVPLAIGIKMKFTFMLPGKCY